MSKDRTNRGADTRKRLTRAMPEPECELDHGDAWQLLIATILSAQSTDKMVNSVTPDLFERFSSPEALAEADLEEVESLVKSTGFYRNKAKAIREASRQIVEDHDGEVPRDIDALTELRGVARKTANLVLGAAFGIPSGIVVDTHAGRVARRLGLTDAKDAKKVEKDLMDLWPEKAWIDMGHRLVLHGRYVCRSRDPACPRCPLNEICPSAEGDAEGRWGTRADREGEVVRSRGEIPLSQD